MIDPVRGAAVVIIGPARERSVFVRVIQAICSILADIPNPVSGGVPAARRGQAMCFQRGSLLLACQAF